MISILLPLCAQIWLKLMHLGLSCNAGSFWPWAVLTMPYAYICGNAVLIFI